jgi:hypothetical protein
MKKSVFLSFFVSGLFAAITFAAEPAAPPAVTAPASSSQSVPTIPVDSNHQGLTAVSAPVVDGSAPAAPAAAEPLPLKGKVLQTMNAGGYSYVYIEQADGKKQWVAVATVPVKVGAEMNFKPGMEMGRFESKALKRSFDSIIFSEGVLSGAADTPIIDPSKGQGTSPGGGSGVSKADKISVPKAVGENAYTVEDAYKKSAKLNKKKVVIAGQVVKVSTGIMNKNWIHIQDGTGSEKKKTHNLVCTSSEDLADVGDVVTITGTLVKDRDFGSGYKYNVIIEDSKITKQ